MQADDLVATHQFRRQYGIGHIHGEIAADAQRGKGQWHRVADQFHVLGQRRVAGVVEIPLRRLHHKPAGVAAVTAVGQAAGVDGVDVAQATELEARAAVVDGMRFARRLFGQPGRDFIGGNNSRPGPVGNGDRVGQMVLMSM